MDEALEKMLQDMLIFGNGYLHVANTSEGLKFRAIDPRDLGKEADSLPDFVIPE